MKLNFLLQQNMMLFQSACGGLEMDGFAPYQLPDGEAIEWRIRPLSATQIAAINLYLREGRRPHHQTL